LAVERSSKEYKKEKKRKLTIAKKQKDVLSRNLRSTNLNADAAMIVDLTKHAKLHLEKIVNGTIASDIPSYLPHGSIMDIFNPDADGNCGFRALAKEVYGSQEEWKRVKDDLQDMYLKDSGLYQEIHGFDHSTIMDILTNLTEVEYYMIFGPLLASLNLTTFTDKVVSLDIGFSFPTAVSLLLTDTFVPFASTMTILSLFSCQQGIAQKVGLPLAFG
jgi:hypothetical protein